VIIILKCGTNQPIAVYGRAKSKCVNISIYINLAQDKTNTSYSKTKSARHGTDEE
jgi:hypothetical protein